MIKFWLKVSYNFFCTCLWYDFSMDYGNVKLFSGCGSEESWWHTKLYVFAKQLMGGLYACMFVQIIVNWKRLLQQKWA